MLKGTGIFEKTLQEWKVLVKPDLLQDENTFILEMCDTHAIEMKKYNETHP
jgi:hypothetical protein